MYVFCVLCVRCFCIYCVVIFFEIFLFMWYVWLAGSCVCFFVFYVLLCGKKSCMNVWLWKKFALLLHSLSGTNGVLPWKFFSKAGVQWIELHKREVKGKIRLCVPALSFIGVWVMDIRILFHRQYMLFRFCLLCVFLFIGSAVSGILFRCVIDSE